MTYFYAYPSRHDAGIIFSSIPLEKGDSVKLLYMKNSRFTKGEVNDKPEYITFLKKDGIRPIKFGMVEFEKTEGNSTSARELELKMGDEIDIEFSSAVIDWEAFILKELKRTGKKIKIARFFRSFYWGT
ncbi:hypothetical protein [Segetibacter aerophilus]|uniref:Uncharacterized protein n=1 Tax=Segetibacter aerophilus TaxID=670293 RepID=A0A512BHU9_9BACT|nr:hypothetical protein [Segetibacter aerophilus]GEO11554.1 hypothetical protein SAE01_40500 [Segetibacter aerophilus]